jgi:nicotinate-nucleotide pyrophosphorylase (carboxylating)
VAKAVALARSRAPHLLKIEVEVRTLAEAEQACAAGADVLLLDNLTVPELRRAVKKARGRAVLEASGNITLDNLRAVADTGVDIISCGALTHSAPAADISARMTPLARGRRR